ncbi:MAG TPA: CBS domain-containing protein [Nitrospiria bacterium]|nr:CBS domain-containing protein [Nitrospiria bacterium]
MRRTEYLTEKREFHKLPASLLMEQDVKFCRPSDSARHIASELTKHNFGSLPVVDGQGMLAGLVSEFDLLKVLMNGREMKDVRAEEIMSREVRFIHEETPVDEIIRLLETDHLIRVPVVREGKLVGIVARRDVLFGYIKSTAEYWP